jgi:hypothetical protein
MPYRGKLEIDDVRTVLCVTNLEYEATVFTINPKIQVPLTTEIVELTFNPVSRLEEFSGLARRNLGHVALK